MDAGRVPTHLIESDDSPPPAGLDARADPLPWNRRALDPWTTGALLIALLVVLPIFSVLWLSLFPQENIWGHLASTVLPGYVGTTRRQL